MTTEVELTILADLLRRFPLTTTRPRRIVKKNKKNKKLFNFFMTNLGYNQKVGGDFHNQLYIGRRCEQKLIKRTIRLLELPM
jgi:hypothetical protein